MFPEKFYITFRNVLNKVPLYKSGLPLIHIFIDFQKFTFHQNIDMFHVILPEVKLVLLTNIYLHSLFLIHFVYFCILFAGFLIQ